MAADLKSSKSKNHMTNFVVSMGSTAVANLNPQKAARTAWEGALPSPYLYDAYSGEARASDVTALEQKVDRLEAVVEALLKHIVCSASANRQEIVNLLNEVDRENSYNGDDT